MLNLTWLGQLKWKKLVYATETPTHRVADLTYLYPGVHLLEVLRTIFTPKKCSLFGYGGVHTSEN